MDLSHSYICIITKYHGMDISHIVYNKHSNKGSGYGYISHVAYCRLVMSSLCTIVFYKPNNDDKELDGFITVVYGGSRDRVV